MMHRHASLLCGKLRRPHCLSGGICCAQQEQAFLRDFALYANNLGGANALPHSNFTSWTW